MTRLLLRAGLNETAIAWLRLRAAVTYLRSGGRCALAGRIALGRWAEVYALVDDYDRTRRSR